MSKLKAENSLLRMEIDTLKEKIASLEGCSSVEQSQYILQQVLQDKFERERCLINLIIYGISDLHLRIFLREFNMTKIYFAK